MNKYLIVLALIITTAIACHKNAFTGRSQFSLIPDSDIQGMALSQYQQFISSNKVLSPTTNKNAAMVRSVAERLITAITQYATEKGFAQELANYKWEVNLVEDKNVNAWCMPGGKIVVYTGILPVTQNETALAIVMGHEIVHALAKHGSERMNQGLLQQFGGMALQVALSSKPQETQNLFNQAYGLGTTYGVMMPFGRKNELEADKFGLKYAALAGYDPREAINFWTRMSQLGGGQKPPEFLSTHPSDERRIADLKAIMPEVLQKYYKPKK